MCNNRSFRPVNSLENYYCETRFGTIRSTPSSPTPPPTPACCESYRPREEPYTAEQLRMIFEVQESIRQHVTRKKQKDEAWVFEKAANGWI